APWKRYHWRVLPQGMKNSPTICQRYAANVLSPVRARLGEAVILHYMDDVLVCTPDNNKLTEALDLTITALQGAGFELQQEKVQRLPPWKYLGLEITNRTIKPQKIQLAHRPETLRELHQLCGQLQWIRPWVGIPPEDLDALFSLLKGGEELDTPKTLIPEAQAALEKVNRLITERQVGRYCPELDFKFIVMGTLPHLQGLIFQWDKDEKDPLLIIEWVFLSHQRPKSITRPQELMAQLIAKARLRLRTLAAYVAGVVSRAEHSVLGQVSNPVIFSLLSKLVHLVSHREQPFFVMHVRSHTDLPGYIAEGNRRADALAAPVQLEGRPSLYQQAVLSHQKFHQNLPGLVRQFHLGRDEAKAIVATCPKCSKINAPSLGNGVNPRGLNSCEVWQTDVTHVPQFGRFKFIHVSVDTFSGAVYASAHTGERAADAKKHLMQAFSFLGIPKMLKTDNGPAYISRVFGNFLRDWGIEHKTGIPYSPTGQAVIERTHQTLKQVLQKQ
ncbi:POK25 protein, partial [Pteruthius melanotis]|nr:POK25 protein [Pteruthius melanotis]